MSYMKKRPNDLPGLRPSPDIHKNRTTALRLISDLIYSSLYDSDNKTEETAFNLSKAWSIKEPPHLPSDDQAMASLIAKEAQDGEYVYGDLNSMVNFHCPLLMNYSFPPNSFKDIQQAWVRFNSNVRALGPTAWGQCRQSLAAQANLHVVKILEFLDGVSECLDQTLSQDITLVITSLDQTITRKTPGRTERYRKVNIERRNNAMEMNRCLSLMHLFYLFYKIGKWDGLDIVTQFFEENIGDLDAFERHCCVLDVEAITLRQVEYDLKNDPHQLIYFVEEPRSQTKTAGQERQDENENAWWQWVRKWVREFQWVQLECGTMAMVQIQRIVNRIKAKDRRFSDA